MDSLLLRINASFSVFCFFSFSSFLFLLLLQNGTFTSNEGITQLNGYLYFLGNCNGTTACLSRIIERDAVNGAFHTSMEYFTGLGDAEGWKYNIHLSSSLFTSPFTGGTLKYHGQNGIGWYVFLCQAYDDKVSREQRVE